MQFTAFRRGVDGFKPFFADHDPVGADIRAGDSAAAEDLGQKDRCRRLALGSGDSDDGQGFCRIAIEGGGKVRESLARVVHEKLYGICRDRIEQMVTNKRAAPGRIGKRRKGMPIHTCAGQTEKETVGYGIAGVIFYGLDVLPQRPTCDGIGHGFPRYRQNGIRGA